MTGGKAKKRRQMMDKTSSTGSCGITQDKEGSAKQMDKYVPKFTRKRKQTQHNESSKQKRRQIQDSHPHTDRPNANQHQREEIIQPGSESSNLKVSHVKQSAQKDDSINISEDPELDRMRENKGNHEINDEHQRCALESSDNNKMNTNQCLTVENNAEDYMATSKDLEVCLDQQVVVNEMEENTELTQACKTGSDSGKHTEDLTKNDCPSEQPTITKKAADTAGSEHLEICKGELSLMHESEVKQNNERAGMCQTGSHLGDSTVILTNEGDKELVESGKVVTVNEAEDLRMTGSANGRGSCTDDMNGNMLNRSKIEEMVTEHTAEGKMQLTDQGEFGMVRYNSQNWNQEGRTSSFHGGIEKLNEEKSRSENLDGEEGQSRRDVSETICPTRKTGEKHSLITCDELMEHRDTADVSMCKEGKEDDTPVKDASLKIEKKINIEENNAGNTAPSVQGSKPLGEDLVSKNKKLFTELVLKEKSDVDMASEDGPKKDLYKGDLAEMGTEKTNTDVKEDLKPDEEDDGCLKNCVIGSLDKTMEADEMTGASKGNRLHKEGNKPSVVMMETSQSVSGVEMCRPRHGSNRKCENEEICTGETPLSEAKEARYLANEEEQQRMSIHCDVDTTTDMKRLQHMSGVVETEQDKSKEKGLESGQAKTVNNGNRTDQQQTDRARERDTTKQNRAESQQVNTSENNEPGSCIQITSERKGNVADENMLRRVNDEGVWKERVDKVCLADLSAINELDDWTDSQLRQLDEHFSESTDCQAPITSGPSKQNTEAIKSVWCQKTHTGRRSLKSLITEVESMNLILVRLRKEVTRYRQILQK